MVPMIRRAIFRLRCSSQQVNNRSTSLGNINQTLLTCMASFARVAPIPALRVRVRAISQLGREPSRSALSNFKKPLVADILSAAKKLQSLPLVAQWYNNVWTWCLSAEFFAGYFPFILYGLVRRYYHYARYLARQ